MSLQEAIRSKTFDLAAFKMEKDLDAMHRMVVDGGLKPLGQGSSRWVFLLSSGKVLKLASPKAPEKGRAQNEAELKASANGRIKPIVAEVYDYDSGTFNWLISEIVRPYKANDTFFHQKFGIPFSVIRDIIFVVGEGQDLKTAFQYTLQKMPKAKQGLLNKETQIFLKGCVSLIKDAGLHAGDLGKIDHWGVTGDGRIVLMDYGATVEVMNQHYPAGDRPGGNPNDQTVVPGSTKR